MTVLGLDVALDEEGVVGTVDDPRASLVDLLDDLVAIRQAGPDHEPCDPLAAVSGWYDGSALLRRADGRRMRADRESLRRRVAGVGRPCLLVGLVLSLTCRTDPEIAALRGSGGLWIGNVCPYTVRIEFTKLGP